MTFKKQIDVMEWIGKLGIAKTVEQIEEIKKEININLEDKIYVGRKVGQGTWTRYELLDGVKLLSKILKIKKIGNDAPKGGQTGNYILFANCKENKEAIIFVDKLLQCMLECK